MIYAFIEAEKARFPVAFMCARLGVSRAGFYEWRTRQHTPAARTVADQQLTERSGRSTASPGGSTARHGSMPS